MLSAPFSLMLREKVCDLVDRDSLNMGERQFSGTSALLARLGPSNVSVLESRSLTPSAVLCVHVGSLPQRLACVWNYPRLLFQGAGQCLGARWELCCVLPGQVQA